jgi:DNA (cytosine-5)-methyltransferase 1
MKPDSPRFIDLFAGCGGLSLGLFEAGWQGVFAIEREQRAFDTLKHNLMGRHEHCFAWPPWLPQQAHTLEELLEKAEFREHLASLTGKVDLLAGGPPCQGFSSLGRRKAEDPRNQLFRKYLSVVEIIRPKLVLIENVMGISHPFGNQRHEESPHKPKTYAEIIRAELDDIEYRVWDHLVYAVHFGVPQNRPRYLFIAADKHLLREDLVQQEKLEDPFHILTRTREKFLGSKKLPKRPITASQAIGDLLTEGEGQRERWRHDDPSFKNPNPFMQGRYGQQRSHYQKLMHKGLNGAPADSHRLANHTTEITERFKRFLKLGPGTKVLPEHRGEDHTKKLIIKILHPKLPAPTVTTLPDDLLHYQEPRILTVRENARLQSFPDWFEFKGKYTTGGKERVKQCPRYTQVGNAVPPLFAEALGLALKEFLPVAFRVRPSKP